MGGLRASLLVLSACATTLPLEDADPPENPMDAEPGVDTVPRPVDGSAVDASIVSVPDAAPPDAAPCLGGTARITGPTGQCYIFFTDTTTWSAARTLCEGLSPPAHLITISSAAENALVAPQLGAADWWTGFTDATSENVWLWYDGTSVAYTNWRTGEPNNANGMFQEDCGIIEGDTGALWDDRACGNTYRRICERDPP